MKSDYRDASDKITTWEKILNNYSKDIPSVGLSGKERKQEEKLLKHYSQKINSWRNKSQRVFLHICRSATKKSHFDWIYENKCNNLSKENFFVDRVFLRKIQQLVFANEHFTPDDKWLDCRANYLEKEFYNK